MDSNPPPAHAALKNTGVRSVLFFALVCSSSRYQERKLILDARAYWQVQICISAERELEVDSKGSLRGSRQGEASWLS